MKVITVSILADPSACKVYDDDGKALPLVEVNHIFFSCHPALSISLAPFTEPDGRQGKLYKTFMLYVLLNIREDICLGLIIICCSPACDQQLEIGKEQIRALHSNSL